MASTYCIWCSPQGKLYDAGQTHIRYVLDHPDLFSRDKEDLTAVYKKFKEPISWEGKARMEILLSLLRDGWIRVRYYSIRNEGWTLEYFASATSRRHLRECMDMLVDEGKASYDDPVHVIGMSDHNGGMAVTRRDDYDFDPQSKEGGVLQFLAASLQAALSEHIRSYLPALSDWNGAPVLTRTCIEGHDVTTALWKEDQGNAVIRAGVLLKDILYQYQIASGKPPKLLYQTDLTLFQGQLEELTATLPYRLVPILQGKEIRLYV